MSFPQILEVAIGLILVYYVLGSVVSMLAKLIMESAETRGVALERYLEKIAGDKVVDLKNLPQIKALQPIRYKNWWNVIGAATEAKKVEKIPAATLVDAFFDLACLTEKKNVNADELIKIIHELPESGGKQAMLKWIEQGVTDINDLRSRTNAYFTGLMDQAAATFKANARSLVIIFSILITFLFGTDSIQLAKDLWSNSELRALAATNANAVVQQGETQTDLIALLGNLSNMSIKIGWWQGQNFPRQASVMDWFRFLSLKFIGLAITAVAVSQGSSFWYDLLKKITSPTSSSSSASSSGGGSSSSSSSSGGN